MAPIRLWRNAHFGGLFFCPETHVLGTLFFSEFRLKKLPIKQEIG